MRSLGYNRLISMENFKKPNFELVADILYWLSMRIEPNANISDDIDEEKDRVEFIKQICILFDQKTRIRMNMKKVY
jgi:clusterin-associated protein 1